MMGGSGLLAGIVALAGLLAAEPPFPEVVRARVPSDSVLKLIPAESQPVGMSIAEFDDLLARAKRLAEDRGQGPRLLALRHRARWRDGLLVGSTELTVASGGEGAGWLFLPRWSPAVTGSPAGLASGESGRLELRIEGGGVRTTTLEWRQAAEPGGDGLTFALEFPDAPVSTFRLESPEGLTVVSPEARAEEDGLWIDRVEGRWTLRLRPITPPTTPPPLEPDLGGNAVIEVQGTSASWVSEWRLDTSARDGRPVVLQLDPAIEHVEVSGQQGVLSQITTDPVAGTRVELSGAGGVGSSPRAIVRGRVRLPARGAWTLPAVEVIGRTWDAPRTLVSLGQEWKLADCRERSGRRVEVMDSDRERVVPRGLLLAFVGLAPGPVADLVLQPPHPRGTAEVAGQLAIAGDRATLDAQVTWTFDGSIPPRLALDLPDGWLIEGVEGDDVDWRIETTADGSGRLELAGGAWARGAPIRIRVKGAAPTVPGSPFRLPRLVPRDVAVTGEGWVLKADPSAWDVRLLESTGLAWTGPASGAASPPGGISIGWRWLTSDARASVLIRPRTSAPGPDLLQVVTLEGDRLRLGALIHWERPQGASGPLRLGWRDLPAGAVLSWRRVDPGSEGDEVLEAWPVPPASPSAVAWFDVDVPDRADAPSILVASVSIPWKGTGEVPLVQAADPRATTRVVLAAPYRYDAAWEGTGWTIPESIARMWLRGSDLATPGLPAIPPTSTIQARLINGAMGPLRLDVRERAEEPARGFLLGVRESAQASQGNRLLHRLTARVVRGDEDELRVDLPQGAKLERLELADQAVLPEREGHSFRLPLRGSPGTVHPLALDYLADRASARATFSLPALGVDPEMAAAGPSGPKLGAWWGGRPLPSLADWGRWGWAATALLLAAAMTARLGPWLRLAVIGACVLGVAAWARSAPPGLSGAVLGGAFLGAIVGVAWGLGRMARRATLAALIWVVLIAGVDRLGAAGGWAAQDPPPLDRSPERLLVVIPYDRPGDALGPASRVVMRREDVEWLRAVATPPRPATSPPRLVGAEHRIRAVGEGMFEVVSSYDLECEAAQSVGWRTPLGSVPESMATLDGRRVPLRVEDGGRTGVVMVEGEGRHRLELTRNVSVPEGGRARLPVNPYPGAVAIPGPGAGVEVDHPRGGMGAESWLGPATDLAIRRAGGAASPKRIAQIDGVWLWDAEVGGDRLRTRLAIRSGSPVSELLLRPIPGSAVRAIEAPGTVSVAWKEIEGGRAWSAQFSPALPDGSQIELEFWKPLLAEPKEVRRPPIPEFANAVGVQGILGFRRPSFRSERLTGREVVPDDEFAVAWGEPFGGDGLSFAGAVRCSGRQELEDISARFGLQSQPLVRQRGRLGVEAGRLVLHVDAELGDDLTLPREADVALPADLQPMRVEGDGLTDWSWDAAAGQLRLRFDGPPLGTRIVHIEGIAAVPSPSYVRPIPWPRWARMREEPGVLALRVEGKRAVALARKAPDGTAARIKPDAAGDYPIDDFESLPLLEVSAPPRRLDVLITSRVTTFPDGAAWDAALEIRSLDGGVSGVSLRIPQGWSDRLAWGEEEGPVIGEVQPDGDGLRLSLRPEQPCLGPWRIWLRSESRGEPSGLPFPDLVPLGEGIVDTYLAWVDASEGEIQLSGQAGIREVMLRSGSPTEPPYDMPAPKTFQVQAVSWLLEFSHQERRRIAPGEPLGLRFRGTYDPGSGAWGQLDAERLTPGVGLRVDFPEPIEPLVAWVGDRVVRPIRLSQRSWRIPAQGSPDSPLRWFWLAKGATSLTIPSIPGGTGGKLQAEVALPLGWSIEGGPIRWARVDSDPEVPLRFAGPREAALIEEGGRWQADIAASGPEEQGRIVKFSGPSTVPAPSTIPGTGGLAWGAGAILVGIALRIRGGRRLGLLAWAGSLIALVILATLGDLAAPVVAAAAGFLGYWREPGQRDAAA